MAPTLIAERLRLLLDAESFALLPTVAAMHDAGGVYDGVVTGLGRVGGQPVVVFAQDSTFQGGSVGALHGQAILAAQQYALAHKLPIIGIWDGGGARLQEGVHALTVVGQIFRNNVLLRGVVPQISLVLGPCAGAACYSPALTDFLIIARDTTKMFLTGPAVTADFIGEHATADQLGGADVHSHNGVADYVAPDAASAIAFARELLGYLIPPTRHSAGSATASQNLGNEGLGFRDPATTRRMTGGTTRRMTGGTTRRMTGGTTRGMTDEVGLPVSPTQPYDVRLVLGGIFDSGSFLELQTDFAPNLVTGLARLAGRAVAIVASQPQVLAGTLDVDATDKGAEFINTVAGLGLPIITFEDVPGFLPGTAQESQGIIRHGAALVAAYVKAQVPKFTIIMRKAYGGAYIAMDSMALGATKVFAWPDAEVSIMGAVGAVDVLHHRALAKLPDDAAAATRAQLIQDFKTNSPGLQDALATGQVSEIIHPSETRETLITSLEEILRLRAG